MAESLRSSFSDLLLREGLITDSQLTTATQVQGESQRSLGRVLVEMGLITERVRMRLLQQKSGCEIVRVHSADLDTDLLRYIPKSLALRHRAVPCGFDVDTLLVAMEDPTDLGVVDEIKAVTQMRIRPVIASINDLDEVLKRYPEEARETLVAYEKPGLVKRLIGDLILLCLLLVPLFLVFFVYVPTNPEMLNRLAGAGGAVDVFVFTLIGFGIYAVIVFEIWSLIFQRRRSKSAKVPMSQTGLL